MIRKYRLPLFWLILSPLFLSCSYRFYPAACDFPLPGPLVRQTHLDSSVAESSGLLYREGLIWTFNDSGGDPVLYGLDPATGRLLERVWVNRATNVDWEDMTADGSYLYLADVGNNFASRDTVLIYRIPLQSLNSGDTRADHAGIISFTYADPVSTNARGNSSHDCEALFEFRDSLYLFTKNWLTESTTLYKIPSDPGHYVAEPDVTYDAGLLVTGADHFRESRKVALVGYHNYMPVVITYSYDADPGDLHCGGRARYYPLKRGLQVEGVCFDSSGNLFISAERTLWKQALFLVGASSQ